MKQYIPLLTIFLVLTIAWTVGIYSACSQMIIAGEGLRISNLDDNSIRISSTKIDTTELFEPAYLLVFNDMGFGSLFYDKPETRSKIFKNFESLQSELDGYSLYEDHKNTQYLKNSIVGIWDLKSMKKLEFTYVEEEKEEKERVVIEVKKWTNKYYIIKK